MSDQHADRLLRLVILNTHSALNTGDAGIVWSQVILIKKFFPRVDISLTSRTPAVDRKIFKPIGVSVFPPLIPAPSVYRGFFYKIWESLKNIFGWRQKIRLVERIRSSDLVIASGGGYFFSNRKFLPGPMFFQNLIPIQIACKFNRPVVFSPQSFGPFFNAPAMTFTRRLLERENIGRIFVREPVSEAFLLKLLNRNRNKVTACPDLMFYLEPEPPEAGDTPDLGLPRPVVALTLRHWHFPEVRGRRRVALKKEQYLRAFSEVCGFVYSRLGGSILVFPQVRGPGSQEDDRLISRKLFRGIQHAVPESHRRYVDLPAVSSPHSVFSILRQADVLVATRFHSAISALLSMIPVVVVSYQPKARGVMESLGLQHYCLDIGDIDSSRMINLLREALDDRTGFRRRMQPEIRRIRETIESHFSRVFSLISPPGEYHEDSAGQ